MSAARARCEHVPVATKARGRKPMFNSLRRFRREVSGLVAEDRPGFKRVDVSPVTYDDGSWLTR
jgi:hypothetical protein